MQNNKNNQVSNTTEIVHKLIKSEDYIKELDINNKEHLAAVKQYFRFFPSKMSNLTGVKEQEWLKAIISSEDSYKLFVSLDKKMHTSELVASYLYQRIKADLQANDKNALQVSNSKLLKNANKDMYVRKSYNDELVISFMYKTLSGEEVNYVDADFQMSIPLVSNAKVNVKVNDGLMFIKKLDYSVSLLGYNTIYSELRRIFNGVLRNTLHKFTIENCRYQNLTNCYSELEEKIKENLQLVLTDYGIEVVDIALLGITIPNNVQETLENDYFSLRRIRLENDNRLDFERKSLELYEKKAEIQAKYPAFTETLSEAEKDNAFNRYASRNVIKNDKVTINKQTLAANKPTIEDFEIKKLDDKITPTSPKQANNLTVVLVILGVLAVIFAIVAIVSHEFLVFLFGSGSMIGIMGVILLVNASKHKTAVNKKIESVDEAMKAERSNEVSENVEEKKENE